MSLRVGQLIIGRMYGSGKVFLGYNLSMNCGWCYAAPLPRTLCIPLCLLLEKLQPYPPEGLMVLWWL